MKFSLVIPVAPERGAEIIESIKELDYPKDNFHVVVVKGRNPSENRNKGAEKSRGNYVVFLDDDAVIEKDYLKKAEEFFNEHPEIDVVGGPQLTPKNDKGFAKISGYALSSRFGAAGSSKRYFKGKLDLNADEKSITSANLIVKKKVMEKIQFDPSLFPGEDPKFIEDAKNAGLRVAYSPEIIIYHRRRPTIKTFFRQNFNYGKVRPEKESFFQTLKNPQFLVPCICILYTIFILGMIGTNPALTGNMIESVKEPLSLNFFLILPFITYFALLILLAFYHSVKNRDLKSFFVLPFIYIVIHLSYGFGMLFGFGRKIFK